MDIVICAACETVIDPSDHPSFCPKCGSGDRRIEVADTVTVEAEERVKLKSEKKRPGEKKAYEEVTIGDDLFHETGQWSRIEQVIDRANDWYRKHITDADGNVLRHCEEPLSQHRGRGSAKHAKPKRGGERAPS